MYAVVDCNNFYCACERVFNPGLQGRPVIVLSNNDGCAISRTEEAKELGIAMASPAFIMRKLIEQHGVAVFSSNYTLYGDMSERIMETLRSMVPRIEIYSIDEAFLDLSETDVIDLAKFGFEIRRTIRQNIGIPVSVGIAPTKTLAKMASGYAKKNYREAAVYLAGNPALTAEMMAFTGVEDIWGIGGQHALFLKGAGIRTAQDLLNVPDDWVRKHLSVQGLRLLYELRGVPAIPWETVRPVRKNVCTSRSFGTRLSKKDDIAEALANYAATCSAKLRSEKSCCRRLEIFIQTNPHKTAESQYLRSIEVQLERASNHAGDIIKAALQGLDLIFKEGFLYMKCGVTAMDLIPESVIQSNCFDQRDRQKQHRMMQTVDEINQHIGKDMVRSAVQGFARSYRLKAAYKSPCYTTRWSEVLKITN